MNKIALSLHFIAGFFLLLLFAPSTINAQGVGINILIPDSSAILHLEATDKGFLPTRLTEQQRDSINNPANGLIIYNTTDSVVQYYNGECWLYVYQVDCGDCYFNLSASSIADTIDRVVSDSASLAITINQYAGDPQNIALSITSALPAGVTYTMVPNPVFSSGTTDIVFHATPFAPAGTYPIVIQTVCGSYTVNYIFSLTILPCYQLQVINNSNNYSLSAQLYTEYPSAPTTTPLCVTVEVQTGVLLSSPSTAQPAFTTGSLPAGSLVAIVNNGNIIGKGGDGGIASTSTLPGAGKDGGDAINLTLDATVINNFNIYAGGGGGNAMAFSITQSLGPITLGILIGAGGGGGAGGGIGGSIPGLIGLTFYSPGTNATSGQFGVPGQGGILNYPINFKQGPVSITITPYAVGGNGGAYGYPGTQGSFYVLLSASAVINIPFIGPITIPIVNNLVLPIPAPVPPAGDSGFAIKRNGFNTNIPDNSYNTSFLKGKVGP